jgi:hypoxanthine phosphoribosyltransferase
MALLLSSLLSATPDTSTMDLLISPDQIAARIAEVGQEINRDYQDKNLTIVMIMKGALCVSADLIRALEVPFKIEYMKASSYGYNGTTAGELTVDGWAHLDIEGRDILIVDDILETGHTFLKVIEKLKEKNPKSIKTLSLLVKNIPRSHDYLPDYTLFTIENRFVIGYGLDYKELYRGLPGIYAFINDTPPF